ncbi:39S ribosomal protein L50, mitochondrial-like isoform X1 [Haliotis rufescens]|uniref:39S ribosomal protein L50, mitochondrial-like isoform X1 n=2 Tax=Haliotis rufescens TaxID=6454 RepID=UPI00201F28AC|nr:39S ribosomal protein L50, mitochondrial-like isoform X1 [Haliotis rufescens]
MAAPIGIMLRPFASSYGLLLSKYTVPVVSQSRSLFWRKKNKEVEEGEVRKRVNFDGPTTSDRVQSLKKKTSVRTNKAYDPPGDLEERLEQLVSQVCGDSVGEWRQVDLADRRVKFKLLTRLMRDLDHTVPNLALDGMATMDDVLAYFSTPVRNTAAYNDLAKLDLPKNLHIQLEPLRFDKDTDTMFGGKTAFPHRPTIVSSLRYKHKYGKEKN